MGDPNGIGPEVLLKALARLGTSTVSESTIFGVSSYLERLAADLDLKIDFQKQRVVDVASITYPPRWGLESEEAAGVAGEALKQAVEFCSQSPFPLLVTAPVSKRALFRADVSFPGQTEFIGSFWPESRPTMAFLSSRFHVLLATVHIPLRSVVTELTAEVLLTRCRLFHGALTQILKRAPRIAVCGLNPHASEDGLFGDEEKTLLEPVIESLNSDGYEIFDGPFPPDTVYLRADRGEFDGVVALYHDQGLIPLKMVAFNSAVNVTLGLPVIRTSPGHGTAFNIAGRGLADSGGMESAILWGLQLVG